MLQVVLQARAEIELKNKLPPPLSPPFPLSRPSLATSTYLAKIANLAGFAAKNDEVH